MEHFCLSLFPCASLHVEPTRIFCAICPAIHDLLDLPTWVDMLPFVPPIILLLWRFLHIKFLLHPLYRLSFRYVPIPSHKVNGVSMLTTSETLPAIGVHLQAWVFVPGMEKAPYLVLPVQLQSQVAGYLAAIQFFSSLKSATMAPP